MRIFILALLVTFATTAEALLLRDNLRWAESGDFLITHQGKCATLLHITEADGTFLTMQEITVPLGRLPKGLGWRGWAQQGAPNHTSWLVLRLRLDTGRVQEIFSVTQNGWIDLTQADPFLNTLLNLPLDRIPDKDRKRVGPPIPGFADRRSFWQPPLIFEGQQVSGVRILPWRTEWPNDGTEMSGRSVEIYLPEEESGYPAYFPYWLQISGALGKAKVRIIDSGKNLKLPVPAAFKNG